ncbi:MAG: undecaprenyldiphospho-muramoylpentapeptide beta-N-acetylglucosaminyltransferase [Lachnospiraceae bacterium]|nr:undecaprenyldiphospho-muramoylpentapeptide beta-N-acetylglucosaminyltransferase [Lachnospiraceae bacterium]
MTENKTKKKIVLTGGGTAGHVTPNLALIPYLKKEGYDLYYVGSINGIEKKLIEDFDVPYLGIETGKLRRYFDPKNFSDPMHVIRGFVEARHFLKEYRPDLIFSKGGYVSVPVTRAAGSLHIPVILHESDMTPGLANKLCFGVATKVCCNFPETMNMLPPEKAVLTGTPIRDELFQGDRQKGLSLCGFADDRPVLMIIGGSQGAASVNKAVLDNLDKLLAHFRIIHICGKGKMDNLKLTMDDYRQFEFVKEDLAHLFAAADVVVSRAGANAICELLSLHKPNILVPLPTAQSRGDQLLNAASFEKQGYSVVVEDDMLADVIVEKALEVYEKREAYIRNMEKSSQSNSIRLILEMIRTLAG